MKTLRTQVYDNAASFAADVTRPVAARAIANNTFLGVLERMVASKATDHLRAGVWDGDQLVLAALMTPPYVLNLADPGRGHEGVEALAAALTAREHKLPGVVGEAPLAEAFAAAWTAHNAVRAELDERNLLYQATEVVHPTGVPGALLIADSANIARHVAWEIAFGVDVDAPIEYREPKFVTERVKRWLAGGVLFDWVVDGRASAHGFLLPIGRDGTRIGAIYTPPENRGHGYAQAMTAALTQRALDEGRWCTLFTDADNPITNKIYPRVGYRYLAAYTSVLFVPA